MEGREAAIKGRKLEKEREEEEMIGRKKGGNTRKEGKKKGS